jgi:hypothetical protein
MRYMFRDLSFEVPAGLHDQSMIVLVDDDNIALTLARDLKEGPLKQYVDDAVTELAASMNAYKLEHREQRKVAGRDAVVLVQKAVSPEGRPVSQLQAYVELGKDVLVVTATSSTASEAQSEKLFEQVLSTLKTG